MTPFKSVRVGPFDISLTTLTGEERDKCLGMFSEHQMSIMLRETFASDQQEAETLLHEVIHACFAVAAIQDKDSHERTVSMLSTCMAQVIRDNPGLIDWLKEKLS
ncbi:MAG: hypothetical protein ACM3IH_03325 [Sphingobacteriales bacterium]